MITYRKNLEDLNVVEDIITVQQQMLFDSFLRALRAENCSKRTLETYGESIKQFIAFLHRKGMPVKPDHITREYIEDFITELLSKWKPATANNRYRALNRYFRWLVEEGEIKKSPMEHMKPPRIPEQSPETLNEDDIRAILKAFAETPSNPRQYCFIDGKDTFKLIKAFNRLYI